MFLSRKRNEDKATADRQKILAYKKFFSSDEGKEILFDLINRYDPINPKSLDLTNDKRLLMSAQSDVIKYILVQANMDIVTYDKLLRGELI